MKTVSNALKTHLAGELTSLAVIWRVRRLDGAEFFFTDASEDLIYEGNTYKAATGFMRSAVSNTSSGSGDDLEVSGVLNDDGIEERDLRAGKFDYAEVWVRAVNYEDLSMGHVPIRYGRFGEVRTTATGKFVIELRGLIAHLANSIGDSYSPDCRVDLFSKKCGMTPTAEQRVASRRYEIGDRISVPSELGADVYALPFPNLDFRSAFYADSAIWQVTNMIARVPEGITERALSPTDWNSSVAQDIGLSDDTVGGSVQVPVKTQVAVTNFGEGLQYRVTSVFKDQTGDTIGTASTGYVDGPQNAFLTVEELCPLGTTGMTFLVDTRRRPGHTGDFGPGALSRLRQPTVHVGADPVSRIQDDLYMSFTLGASSLSGWSGAGLAVYTSRMGFSRPEGRPFVAASRSTRSIGNSGQVSLVGGPISGAMIDSGAYVVDLKWLQANLDISGMADIQVVFFGTGLPSSGRVSPLELVELPTAGAWRLREKVIMVPPGARTASLRQTHQHSRNNIGGSIMSAIADIEISLRPAHDISNNFVSFGGVEYEALNAGRAAAQPAVDWTRDLGNEVSDGELTWRTVVPEWSNLTTISTVLSRGVFTLAANVDRPDAFFRWGLILFLTGPNAGFTADVVQWTASSRRIDLVLPTPYLPQTGDQVWVQTGCDKMIDTCYGKFNNVLNFRGEPWLPGTDQYFRIGQPS